MSRGIDRDALTTRPPFDRLFPVDKEVLGAITESIRSDGFDWERPIMVWKNDREIVVVDGHTRLAAARKARLKQVPVIVRKFADETAALEYAIIEQRNRRNMSREEQAAYVLRVVEALDQPAQGKRTDLETSRQPGGKLGAERTAELAGTSTRQVERARRVKESDNQQVKRAVRNGKMTLPAAERKVKGDSPAAAGKSKDAAQNAVNGLVGQMLRAPGEDIDETLMEVFGVADDALRSLKDHEPFVLAQKFSPDVQSALRGAIYALGRLVSAAEVTRVGKGG